MLCLQHTAEVKIEVPKIQRNIKINGTYVTYDESTNFDNSSKQLNAKYNSVAARIAYILSCASMTKPANSNDRKSNGAQGALWNNIVDYYNNFPGDVDGDFKEAVLDPSSPYYDWAHVHNAKKIDKEAKSYEGMIQHIYGNDSISFSSSNYKWRTLDSGHYIIGPFTAWFTDWVDNNKRTAGEYGSVLDNASGAWHFCDSAGNAITPSYGQAFYIKVQKAKVGTGTTLRFRARRLHVSSEFWTLRYPTDSQRRLYLVYGTREWITTGYDFAITPPSLEITKIDVDTNAPIGGMQFVIKNSAGQYLTSMPEDNLAVFGTTNKSQAMILTTNQNGKISIPRIETGTYYIEEVGVGTNWQYEVTNAITTKEVVAGNNYVTITNKKVYIELAGKVWLDRLSSAKPQGEMNGLYYQGATDNNDKLLNGITVRLKDKNTKQTVRDKNGQEITTKTSGNGEYSFKNARIDQLSTYYIEFEYDGLTYTNVDPTVTVSNGSKAKENQQERSQFEDSFSVIEGEGNGSGQRLKGIRTDSNGNEKHDITYIDNGNHQLTLDNVKYKETEEQQAQSKTLTITADGHYKIIADTNEAGYNIYNSNVNYYIVDGIKNINLGLYERDQPDIALAKDLENVRVTINGYENTYKYAMRYINMDKEGNDAFNVGVKFGEKYGNMSYSRAIYKADYEYENENNKDNELQVYITYRIMIKNNTNSESGNEPTLVTKINNIVDYYDKEFTLISAGTEIDERGNVGTEKDKDGNVKGSLVPNNQQGELYGDGTYKKINIDTNIEIASQEYESIFVQFLLSREKVASIIDEQGIVNEDQVREINNIAEVTSYSVFNNGKVYSGIDTDSNPGNAVPDNGGTYEDDTDSSPALRLEVANAREVSGNVFEDLPVQVDEDGNMVLDSNGNAMTLDKNQLMTGKIRQGNGIYDVGTETGIGGVEVTLKEEKTGIEYPTVTTDADGNYSIDGFIPGDYTLTYKWGDDTYTVQNYKGTIYREKERQNDPEWYKTTEPRYSDAMDDYATRIAIDNETKTVKYDTKDKVTIKQMESTTPKMEVGVELDSRAWTENSGEHKYTYDMSNIDFGIIERAKQELALEKRIKTVKVILANGQTIVDVSIGEDGKVSSKNVTYMRPSESTQPNNGFLKIELDNELIQGAILQVGYGLRAINNSEVDYISEDFYKYGEISGDIVTLKSTKIIDYLDTNWPYNKDENTIWTQKTKGELETEKLVSSQVYNNIKDNSKILYTEQLKDKILKPKKSTEAIMIQVSKMLTTTDEIVLDNESEIIEIQKTGGSIPEPIPGNYVPGNGSQEVDDDMAETITVTPNTGENQNYIIPIVIGITAFIILGVGVVIIKKKVLDE